MAQLLLADVDLLFSDTLKNMLQNESYQIDLFTDGEKAFDAFKKNDYNLCIFNTRLHNVGGLDLLVRIRSRNVKVPIIILSNVENEPEKLKAFAKGADHYQHKPLSLPELLARIKVFLWRTHTKSEGVFKIGHLRFNAKTGEIFDDTGKISQMISETHSKFFAFLCENPDRILKRSEILLAVWGKTDYFCGRSMDVYVSRTRKILKETQVGSIITHHNIGFQFEVFGTEEGADNVAQSAKIDK